jgi:hypothetical protein
MKQAAFAALLVIATIHSAVASPESDAAQIHSTAIGAGDTSIIQRNLADRFETGCRSLLTPQPLIT